LTADGLEVSGLHAGRTRRRFFRLDDDALGEVLAG